MTAVGVSAWWWFGFHLTFFTSRKQSIALSHSPGSLVPAYWLNTGGFMAKIYSESF